MILQIIILSLGYLLMAILGIAVKIILKPYSTQIVAIKLNDVQIKELKINEKYHLN